MNKKKSFLALSAIMLSAPCLATDCLLPASAQPSLSMVAPEMLRPVSADPYCVSVPDLLARIRAQAASMATGAPGAYVPLTKDDNTPWRFDMSQNGKRMTSDQFDAWMKAKGIRVATGKPSVTEAPVSPPPAAQGSQ